MTKGPVFVDTNILVAASSDGAPFHQEAIAALDKLDSEKAEIWISRQVLRELLATLSRLQPWGGDVDGEALARLAERYAKIFRIADENQASMARLLAYVRDGRARGKQVHDAAIAAVMAGHGIRRLLTLNRAHFERFSPDLILETPGG